MEPHMRKLNPSPQSEANILSKLSFWWTHEVFRLGYKRQLEERDIHDVLPEDSSVKLSNDLGREWEKETYRWKTGGRPSLYRALFRCYGANVIGIGFFFLLEEVFRIGQAVFLGLLVTYFEPGSDVSTFRAYMYALGWSLTYIFIIIFDNVAFHKSFYFGLKMRVGCTSLIYRKLMRLSQHAIHDVSINNILSLISTDAQRFEQSCLGINYLWIGPLETLCVVVLLWRQLSLGAYSLIGVGVIALLVPAQYLLGNYITKIRFQLSQVMERRAGVMYEIIAGIKTIKINVWEKPFSSLITTVRSSEWRYLRGLSHYRSLNSALYLISGKVIMFATFVTYVFLGYATPASVIFTALALYEILRSSIGLLLPWGIQYFKDALEAATRIEKFLLLEERNILETHLQMFMGRPPLPDGVAVRLEDYSASWARGEKTFKIDSVNVDVQVSRLVVLIGKPGSGRSSLLMAVLGELPRLGGFLRTRGKLGYVPQTPWLFRGTIRDNILFGRELNNQQYNKVLHACGLLPDLEHFTRGDMAEIDDKDVNLSNSQRVKICLARAIYLDADIYLVDDIFCSVDERTAIHIFTKCFCGLLNTKTIIYVTSNLNLVKAADHIVVLQQGKVEHQGSWEDLKNIGLDFRDVTGTYDEGDPEPESDQIIEDGLSKNQLSLTVRRRNQTDGNVQGETTDNINIDFKSPPLPQTASLEEKDKGTAGWLTYWSYFKAGGGTCALTCFIILCILLQASYICVDWWLFHWSQHQWLHDATTNTSSNPSTTSTTFTTATSANITTSFTTITTATSSTNHSSPSTSSSATTSPITSTSPSISISGAENIVHNLSQPLTATSPAPSQSGLSGLEPHIHFYIYLGLFSGFLLLALLRAFVFSVMAVSASRTLHVRMFKAFMRAPMAFFEKYTPGRLLTRFTRDLMIIDDPLPASLFDCIQFLSLVLGMVILVGSANFWLFLIMVPLTLFFFVIRYYFMTTSRQVKHLEVTARSPIYHHLACTLEGLWTIRAFRGEERFVRLFDFYMDRHTSAAYTYLAVSRWFAVRLDFLTAILIALIAVISIAIKTDIDAGLLGLALAQALSLMGLFQYSVRQIAEVDNQMASLDRVQEVCDTLPEGDMVTDVRPASPWPQYGIVTFEGVSLSIDKDVNKMLKNLWGCVRAEEKVGVISQPSGCKKALMAAILRLAEPHGIVRIDGVDIKEVGLQDLREQISVIEQDPVLFGGSIRRNLDPFTRYPDALVWKALSTVMLKDKIERFPGKMYAELSEYGHQFSLGDRQLLALARALLTNSKIIIFEETHSVLDRRSEAVIQYVLRHKFAHKTVIVLAHSPQSVIDMDRIMVLDNGRIKEFDSAHLLLQQEAGIFYRLINALPSPDVRRLMKVALDKHENKPYRPPPQSVNGEQAGQQSKPANFLPSFQTNRLSGVLSHFTGNRFSTNRF